MGVCAFCVAVKRHSALCPHPTVHLHSVYRRCKLLTRCDVFRTGSRFDLPQMGHAAMLYLWASVWISCRCFWGEYSNGSDGTASGCKPSSEAQRKTRVLSFSLNFSECTEQKYRAIFTVAKLPFSKLQLNLWFIAVFFMTHKNHKWFRLNTQHKSSLAKSSVLPLKPSRQH